MTISKEGVREPMGWKVSNRLHTGDILRTDRAVISNQDPSPPTVHERLNVTILSKTKIKIWFPKPVIVDLSDPDSDPHNYRDIVYWQGKSLLTQHYRLVYSPD